MRIDAAHEPMRLLGPEHRAVTLSLVAAISLVSYNNLSVTAALPAIGDDLGDVALLPWVITAELLAAAIAVLAIGPLVDGRGVRAVFQSGMLGFVVASLACAVAPSMLVLVVARVAQGLMMGVVIGSNLAAIGLAYEEALRPRAYALVSAVWGVMGIGGPAIAAVVVSVAGWRAVFAVCLPVGLAACMLGWGRLPGRRDDTAEDRFDRTGFVMLAVVTVGLLLATSAISIWTAVWFGVALVCFFAYLRHAARRPSPVVRVEHLTAARWRWMHVSSTMAVAGGTGSSAFLPLYLRGARDASESAAAFSVLYLVLGWSAASWVASKAQERVHAAHIVHVGSWLIVVGTALATFAAWRLDGTVVFLSTFIVMGSGIGLVTTAGLTILQGRARAEEMGRVSSAHQFLRTLGFAYGAAVAGAVIFLVVGLQIDDVETVRELLGSDSTTLTVDARDALQDGFVWSLVATATFSLVGVVGARHLVRNIGRFTGV